MLRPTETQLRVLGAWLAWHDFHGVIPSLREVSEMLGCGMNTVRNQMCALQRCRLAQRQPTWGDQGIWLVTPEGRQAWIRAGTVYPVLRLKT